MPKFIEWIPTQEEFINSFFQICPLSTSDTVYDLGSGDGRLLFAALQKGAAKCVGVDINPDQVKVASEAATRRSLNDKIKFIEADVMDVDLSEASVIFCYLCTTASAALKPKFEKELKPGTRIVMESFPIHGWKPIKESVTNGRDFYFYIMPPEKIG
jgi:ribosomal protein L11 methylase PrmA